jgi:hypothetical protein
MSPPDDEIETAMLRGAVIALRRRAASQEKIAQSWTSRGDRGVNIRTGEGAIAARLAHAFNELAVELEAEAAR